MLRKYLRLGTGVYNMKTRSEIAVSKLKKLVKLIDYKLEYSSSGVGGIYQPATRTILITRKQPTLCLMATLLHELGHHFYECALSKSKVAQIDKSYERSNNNRPLSELDIETILTTEKQAWIMGRSVAKILHIKLGKWYEDEYKINYATYVRELK